VEKSAKRSGFGAYIRTLEDVIVNSAIHDIHSARWIMGQEIAGVYVQWVAAHPERPGTCRFLVVQMTFQNNALGTIECNADSGYGYEVCVEITGESGSARTAPTSSPTLHQSGTISQAIDRHWSKRFNTAYLDEMRAWTRSILEQKPTGPSAWDGYMSLVVADACIRSAKTGQPQKVPVVERPALYQSAVKVKTRIGGRDNESSSRVLVWARGFASPKSRGSETQTRSGAGKGGSLWYLRL
jgi:myo-inositol 2-dehydrogenase/D-chiro-inositol 1-dehydrogenase